MLSGVGEKQKKVEVTKSAYPTRRLKNFPLRKVNKKRFEGTNRKHEYGCAGPSCINGIRGGGKFSLQ